MKTENTSEGGTACNSSSDCGDGYKCVNGRCVKDDTTMPIVIPPVGNKDVKEDK